MTYDLENARPLIALLGVVFVCWLLSEEKRRFPWRLAIGAILLQAALVLLLFGSEPAQYALDAVNGAIDGLASGTIEGTQFIFGYLAGGEQPFALKDGAFAPLLFGFQVLPLILVISALSAMLWHWGVLKWVIRGMGFLFQRTMGLGGASALATAANIFMGMVESPIVVRAYLDKLTRSELFMMMVVGLATVAGSTMVAYAAILKNTLPNAGGHVLVASIISAPAGVLLARIMVPEKKGEAGAVGDYTSALRYDSTMDAIMKGVQDGLMVVVNVAAMLIVFVAFVGIANNLLAVAPDVYGAPLTLQRIMGWAFSPLAWAIGIPWSEAQAAGGLLGSKLFLTEFKAFIDLGMIPADQLSARSRMIMTYALCGFANVASVGIMTGGMTVLMPDRRAEILNLAWKALPPGFLATIMTASVVAALPRGLFG